MLHKSISWVKWIILFGILFLIPTTATASVDGFQQLFVPLALKINKPYWGSDGNLYLENTKLLDYKAEAGGCFGGGSISSSPTDEHFLVVLPCFEGDDDAFLFRYDGYDKRKITNMYDYFNYGEFYWSTDGKSFIYARTTGSGLVPPPGTPPSGWVRYIIETGTKIYLGPLSGSLVK